MEEVPRARDDFPLYLQPYEPSYVIFRRAKPDENALNARYSFRYLFTNEASPTKYRGEKDSTCGLAFWHCDWEFFASYTGEFDFYWNARPSSPVVNRLNNPAAHLRWVVNKGTWLDFALEHRSNGQSLDIDDQHVADRARAAYQAGDHSFFDSISRDSNYLSFTGSWRPIPEADYTGQQYTLQLKHYVIYEESAVKWGPLDGKKSEFVDYDRMRLGRSVSMNLKHLVELVSV